MTDLPPKTLKTYASIAGISLLIMTVAAIFAVGWLSKAETEIPNDTVSWSLRGSIGAWLLILITDVLVAWALYVLLRPVDRFWSLLSGWLRMLYAGILGMAIVFLLLAKQSGLESTETALTHIATFRDVWSFGLILFGFHLLILGPLCVKSEYVPKWIGYLITLAGVGYVIIHLGNTLVPDFSGIRKILEMIFMLPMIVGEVGLAIWLLVRRNRLPELVLVGQ